MDGRLYGRVILAACLLLAAPRAAVAADLLIAPTQGRPEFVAPGGQFTVVAALSGASAGVSCWLVSRQEPAFEYKLAVVGDAAKALNVGEPLTLRTPDGIPQLTYDLEIRDGRRRLVGRRSVCVKNVGDRIRVAQLSNMNIGDVDAPRFDERLVDELNLLAPDVIVLTGDYVDVTHDDPEQGWRDLSDFLAKFEAPTIMACGDHDSLELYTRYAATSPVFSVDLGRYRFVVAYDTPTRPIDLAPDQATAVERQLVQRPAQTMTVMVTHDSAPNLLYYWADNSVLTQMRDRSRLLAWFAGGHRDWNGRDHRAVIDAMAPMAYLRSQESSTSTRGGASGRSCYQAFDFVGEQVTPVGVSAESAQSAISRPVGQAGVVYLNANDGASEQVAFAAANHGPRRIEGMRQRVVIRNPGRKQPYCLGAKLIQAAHVVDQTVCWVEFSLPDRSALRAVVGSGTPPMTPNVSTVFEAPLRLQQRDGVLTAEGPLRAHLTNNGAAAIMVKPVGRLAGCVVPYRVAGEQAPLAAAFTLRLNPKQSVTLEFDVSRVEATPGEYEFQVYLKGGAVWGPEGRVVEIERAR